MAVETKRFEAGPLETYLVERAFHRTEATHEAFNDTLNQFRKDRSRNRHNEYQAFPLKTKGPEACVVFVSAQSPYHTLMGLNGNGGFSALRIELEHYTLVEFQEKHGPGKITRNLSVGLATRLAETDIAGLIGQTVDAIITLPDDLKTIYDGYVIESGFDSNDGTAFSFHPSKPTKTDR